MKNLEPVFIPPAGDDARRETISEKRPSQPAIKIWQGDCRNKLKEIPDNWIHMVRADPPYFWDGLDNR